MLGVFDDLYDPEHWNMSSYMHALSIKGAIDNIDNIQTTRCRIVPPPFHCIYFTTSNCQAFSFNLSHLYFFSTLIDDAEIQRDTISSVYILVVITALLATVGTKRTDILHRGKQTWYLLDPPNFY